METKLDYYWKQSPLFKKGFRDYLDRNAYGFVFDPSKNLEWQRGWKWAELNVSALKTEEE